MKKVNFINSLEFKNSLNELKGESMKNLKILISIFIICILFIYYLVKSFPELDPNTRQKLLNFSYSVEYLRILANIMIDLSVLHYYKVLILFLSVYIL